MTDVTQHAFTTFAKLIGIEFINQLPSNYKQLKKFLPKVNVYGTVDNPLFIAKEVQEALNNKDKFNARNFSNDILTQYITKTIRFRGQQRKVLFLTEHGIHKVLSSKRGKEAEQFQCFVSLALKNLYKYKETSLKEVTESANFHQDKKEYISLTYMDEVDKLKKVIEEQQKRISKLNGLTHDMQMDFNEVSDKNDKLTMHNDGLNIAKVMQHKYINKLTNDIKQVRQQYDLYNPSSAAKLDKFRDMHFAKIEVFLLPHDICDTKEVILNLDYDYDLYNDIDIDEVNIMLYTMVKKVESRGIIVPTTRPIDKITNSMIYTGYIPKPVDIYLKQVKQYIATIVNPITYKHKKFIIYETSLDQIKAAFNLVESLYLKKCKWSKEWNNILISNGKN